MRRGGRGHQHLKTRLFFGILSMAGNVLLRTVLRQATDFVLDALLPRASSAAVPRSAAKLPAQVQGAAAAAFGRSTARLPAQAQGGGGAMTMTMAEMQARRAKMIGEELKDYKIHRRRRDLSKQAAERRNKVHTARVVVGSTAVSALAAAGIYSYKARGGDAAPSV